MEKLSVNCHSNGETEVGSAFCRLADFSKELLSPMKNLVSDSSSTSQRSKVTTSMLEAGLELCHLIHLGEPDEWCWAGQTKPLLKTQLSYYMRQLHCLCEPVLHIMPLNMSVCLCVQLKSMLHNINFFLDSLVKGDLREVKGVSLLCTVYFCRLIWGVTMTDLRSTMEWSWSTMEWSYCCRICSLVASGWRCPSWNN